MPPVDAVVNQVTGNVALTAVEAQVAQFTTNPEAPSPSGTRPVLVIVTLPNVTGVAAGASVTVNVRSGTTSSGTLIGSATATNSGAGAAAVGAISVQAPLPAGSPAAIFVGAIMSSGTGTAVASATAPIVSTAINLD